MINNTSLGKWDRLSSKQPDQQFITEMIHGLGCSPFEASAILDMVYKVYTPLFETSAALKPGQIRFQVVSATTPASVPLAQAQQLTVTLTLDAGPEDIEVRRASGVVGLRRHRLQRMCIEAFQQEGLLTIEDMANRLLNCGERTLCRDLKYLRDQQILLPLRSTIQDMGRTLSHRTLIIRHWLKGLEYSQIAQATHHSLAAVHNYVDKFKRIAALAEEGFDVNTIAFLVKVSTTLAEEYFRLYHDQPCIASRKHELETFLKGYRAPGFGGEAPHD